MYQPTADDLADLKIALGVAADDTSQDPLLNFLLVRSGTVALNEINATYLPAGLQPLVVDLAADAYKINQNSAIGIVSSLSDNGQAIGYASDSILRSVMSVLKNYTAQFDQFRNPGW